MRKNKLDPIPVVIGRCPLCQTALIKSCKSCGSTAFKRNHCQFRVGLSNGTETYMGVCRKCFDKMTDEQVSAMYEGIKLWWLKNGDPSPFNEKVIVTYVNRESVE